MKNIILTTLFFVFTHYITEAQSTVKTQSLLPIKYGVKIGANIGSVISSPNEGVKNIEQSTIFGIAAGFYMEIALNDKWYINPSVVYIQKGLSASSEYIHNYESNQQDLHKVAHDLTLSYVELNPTLSYKINDKISLNTGPSLSMQLSYQYTANDKGEHDASPTHEILDEWVYNEESLDIGLNLGMSYYLNENIIIESTINNGFLKSGELAKDISTAGNAGNDIKQNIFELRNKGFICSFIYLF